MDIKSDELMRAWMMLFDLECIPGRPSKEARILAEARHVIAGAVRRIENESHPTEEGVKS